MKLMPYGLLALVLCGLAGCGANASIVGTWEPEQIPGIHIEYTSDGKTFVSLPGKMGKQQTGTYEIQGNKLKQTEKNAMTGQVETKESTIKKLTDTELILETGGVTVAFKRK